MFHFILQKELKQIFYKGIGIKFLLFIFIFLITVTKIDAQQCNFNQFCKTEDLGKLYDYRGQSTIAKLSPGDTCRVQAILYSGNEIRIMICSDPKLGQVQFKIYRTVRDYKRIIEKIERKEINEPIYKTDKKGNPVPKFDDWGKPLKDNMGEIQFEIINYKRMVVSDTIWKIVRNSKDEIIFDSRKGSKLYINTISKTEPIMIEMVVPETSNTLLKKYKGCVGIMIGRIFRSTNFKGFEKSE